MSECQVRFRKLILKKGIDSSETQERFLSNPCQACGSHDHSLLRLTADVANTGVIKYEYECHVIDPTPLYPENNWKRMTIKYYLSAARYAEECGFDLDRALGRRILRKTESKKEYSECLDSFLNEVRSECIRHAERIPVNTPQPSSESAEQQCNSGLGKRKRYGISPPISPIDKMILSHKRRKYRK